MSKWKISCLVGAWLIVGAHLGAAIAFERPWMVAPALFLAAACSYVMWLWWRQAFGARTHPLLPPDD